MDYKTKFNKVKDLVSSDIVRITNNPFPGSDRTLTILNGQLAYIISLEKIKSNAKKSSKVSRNS